MNKYKFTISIGIGSKVFLIISGILVIGMLLILPVTLDYTTDGIIILSHSLAIMLFIAIYCAVMMRIKVQDLIIKVRTATGRNYQLTCADIMKIECYETNSIKRGREFNITVSAKQNEFTIYDRLENFSAFVGYILDMLNNGEISTTAVSTSCLKELRRYHIKFKRN